MSLSPAIVRDIETVVIPAHCRADAFSQTMDSVLPLKAFHPTTARLAARVISH